MQKGTSTDTMILAARYFGERIYVKKFSLSVYRQTSWQTHVKNIQSDNLDKWEGITLVCDPKTKRIVTVFKNRRWLKKYTIIKLAEPKEQTPAYFILPEKDRDQTSA